MTAKKVQPAKMKAYSFTISGTYRNSKKEYIDFENVKGVIPFCEPEIAEAMIRARYAEMLLAKSKKYPERAASVREVFIDSLVETESHFDFVGKNIVDLGYEDLQDLATAKDLRAIPLYKKGGLRQARMVAYSEFSAKVLGRPVDIREKGFNLLEQPAIVVDEFAERNTQKGFSNDEMIQMEQDNKTTEKLNFSREELEKLATEKNIGFNPAITDVKLHQKIFNGA